MESPPNAPKRVGPAPKYDWDAHKEMIVPLYEQKGYDEMATELKKIGFAPSYVLQSTFPLRFASHIPPFLTFY